ncbi:LITAF [Branchiostoma lanceolatum]|uniref:LITAF protein n=1 Tax=Branchiostoma lanceolatum TaxID=7740 RepID=A0A8J9VHK2_BRALA|nr:LITAF [Branchiostoma lanceolatum]
MSEKVAPAADDWQQPPPSYPTQAAQPGYQQQYPPPQSASYQQPPTIGAVQSTTTVVVPQPGAVVVSVNPTTRSSQPVRLTCPSCRQDVLTTVQHEVGMFTWLMVGAVFLFGFAFPLVWLGCCFIPLCIRDFKDPKHTCPNCNTHLGTHKRGN